MKLFRKKMISLLLAAAGFAPAIQGMQPGDLLRRRDFVQDIVGQPERAFRAAFGWRDGFFTVRPQGGWGRWAGPGGGRRRTISMIGDRGGLRTRPRIKTVHEWNGKIGARPQPLGRPRFVIKFHDPLDPELTDIRYMQAERGSRPRERWAFQIASTFHALEGQSWKLANLLEDTVRKPVQGEEATIATAGATIFRKYFWPYVRRGDARPQVSNRPFIHLLGDLTIPVPQQQGRGARGRGIRRVPVVDYDPGTRMPHLNQNLLPHCTLANTSSDYVGVVIQEDIAVTSGLLRGDRAAYFDPGKPYAGYQRKFHYPYPRVTHIFCSAYDMKGAGPRPTPGHRAFAKVVLNGMYEGTIKAAYKRNIPNVVLTMLGGGSFRNRIDWIGHAIKHHVAPFVQRYGMHVDLVFHPDKPRRGAVRNANDDYAFLMDMISIADGINQTGNAQDGDVQRHVRGYLDAHYSGNGQAASVAARWLTQHVRF